MGFEVGPFEVVYIVKRSLNFSPEVYPHSPPPQSRVLPLDLGVEHRNYRITATGRTVVKIRTMLSQLRSSKIIRRFIRFGVNSCLRVRSAELVPPAGTRKYSNQCICSYQRDGNTSGRSMVAAIWGSYISWVVR